MNESFKSPLIRIEELAGTIRKRKRRTSKETKASLDREIDTLRQLNRDLLGGNADVNEKLTNIDQHLGALSGKYRSNPDDDDNNFNWFFQAWRQLEERIESASVSSRRG